MALLDVLAATTLRLEHLVVAQMAVKIAFGLALLQTLASCRPKWVLQTQVAVPTDRS